MKEWRERQKNSNPIVFIKRYPKKWVKISFNKTYPSWNSSYKTTIIDGLYKVELCRKNFNIQLHFNQYCIFTVFPHTNPSLNWSLLCTGWKNISETNSILPRLSSASMWSDAPVCTKKLFRKFIAFFTHHNSFLVSEISRAKYCCFYLSLINNSFGNIYIMRKL